MQLQCILLSLLLLPLVAAGSFAGAEYSFSVVSMKPLVQLETKLIQNLDEYVKVLEHKLQILRTHILEMRLENEKAKRNVTLYLSHPLNAFALIRRLHLDWVQWRNYMERFVGGAQIRNFDAWRKHLPTQLDLQDACNGIARIQDTYGLQEKHIMRGQLAGIQYNISMSTSDIFAVGQHLSRTTNAQEAIPWLQEVNRRLGKQTPGPLAVDKTEVLLLLAETYIKSKHYAEALPVLDVALKDNTADAVLLRRREEVQQLIAKEPNTILDKEKPEDNPKVAALKWGCRGFSGRPPRSSKVLHCSYNFTTTPFLRLAPLKMELLGQYPYVVVYHDVLSDSEIAGIVEMAEQRLARTATIAQPNRTSSPTRTAMGAWLKRSSNALTRRIARRVEDMSGLQLEGSERMQVINYGIGGHYGLHKDWFDQHSEVMGNRLATVLFYLTDVEQGGATIFTKSELQVMPRRGNAIFWYNLHTNGEGDWSTTHAACPIIVGSKWVLTQWIRERNQAFIRPCLDRD